MKINNQTELCFFLDRFKASVEQSFTDFPENITLEIDSSEIKKEIEDSMQIMGTNTKVTLDRGEYMGVKICFKSPEYKTQSKGVSDEEIITILNLNIHNLERAGYDAEHTKELVTKLQPQNSKED